MAMREMRQCSALERMRSSRAARFASVPVASRLANSRAGSSVSASHSSAQYMRTSSSARTSETSAAKSICKAYSRALRREPITISKSSGTDFSLCCLLNHRLKSVPLNSFLEAFPVQICQLDSRRSSLEPLVTQLNPGAIDRLLECVRRDNAKQHRHACLHSCLGNAPRYFACDVFE